MTEDFVEKYKITEGGLDIEVKIIGKKGHLKTYQLVQKQIEPPTRALLDSIKQELIGAVRITAEEILDPKKVHELKERFSKKTKELIKRKLPHTDHKTEELLTTILMKEMLGLGDIEILLGDLFLEEIIVLSASEPVRVFHKKYGWLDTNVYMKDEIQIRDHFNVIARRVGRQITTLTPLLDAHLVTGDRANAVLYPISSKGNTLTVRKFARDPWTVTDLINNNTCSVEVFALIWLLMQYEMNILISGGTGSGKTSFLNVCMPFIPPNHRVISIEDTRELMLPDFLFWCPLTTREPNAEGKGAVDMIDLLINSLRMRPDRIVLGEMRKKEQAEVLFEAMHTGHSVYATVHADSVFATVQRLTSPPIEVPPNLLMSVNLNVVMFRDRRKNIRRVYQIGEYLTQMEEGKVNVKPNITHRYNPTVDKMVGHQRPVRLYEDLSRHAGLSTTDINEDLAKKRKILEWMVKHKVRDVQSVGKIMKLYYINPDEVVKLVNKNSSPETILGKSVKNG